jgi:hypothetical protein
MERDRELNPGNREVTRRRLVGAGAMTAALLLLGGALYRAWQVLHPQPFPYDADLSATATAATEEGLQTTLRAESPFTDEMIQEVLDNTGTLIIEFKNGATAVRSGWLAQGPGKGIDIVTIVHDGLGGNTVGPNGKSTVIKNIRFIRPHVDEFSVDADKCTFFVGQSPRIPQDVALINVPTVYLPPLNAPASGIPFKDNYKPTRGKPVLFAGIPSEFLNRANPLLSITEGGVTQVSDIDSSYEWGFKGIAAIGSSGGPVCVAESGQLTGVGVVIQAETYTEELVASSLPLNDLHNSIAP